MKVQSAPVCLSTFVCPVPENTFPNCVTMQLSCLQDLNTGLDAILNYEN